MQARSGPLVIAIDGPAGSGKSTLARGLALALDLPYLNTGLMYRAVTLEAIRQQVDPGDAASLTSIARALHFDLDEALRPPELRIDGVAPDPTLASPEVEARVSTVAAHPELRAVLRAEQRRLGEGGGVIEGRDIGSMVFPDADLRVLLEARPEERAARRAEERPEASTRDVSAAISERDRQDERNVPPVDADLVIDSSDLDADTVLRTVLTAIRERIGRTPVNGPPTVAVIGRQNVGKSTLVNRLFGGREAIAHEMPGVTRDRVELDVTWRGRSFRLVDTGGFQHRGRGIEALVSAQAERAAESADLVLLVVDARTGPLEEDSRLARRLRRSPIPLLLVVNKVDTERDEPDAAAFHALGLGEPVTVSGLHGRGSGDLLDRIVALLPPDVGEARVEGEPRIALVGRPNVGKSSLFNRLVGEERSVVFEEAGTTRDSVDAVVSWPTGPVRFVDTAGFRRPTRLRGVEYYSTLRAERAIERAEVAMLVLEAPEGFTAEDKRIASRVMELGRSLLVVANKWDLVEGRDRAFKELTEEAARFARASVVRTSALTGGGVGRLPAHVLELHGRHLHRASTAEVNRLLQEAQAARPGPVRYRYGTQVSAGPPTFVLFGGRAPDVGYRRFLENRLRRELGLDGVPIRLRFRAGRATRS